MRPASIFIVTQFGKPVGPPRKEIGETRPAHADMLRYDRAFHDPNDPSRIVFPEFVGFKTTITYARWSSFLMGVRETDEMTDDYGDWLTYCDFNPDHAPITLKRYLAEFHYKLKG